MPFSLNQCQDRQNSRRANVEAAKQCSEVLKRVRRSATHTSCLSSFFYQGSGLGASIPWWPVQFQVHDQGDGQLKKIRHLTCHIEVAVAPDTTVSVKSASCEIFLSRTHQAIQTSMACNSSTLFSCLTTICSATCSRNQTSAFFCVAAF